MRSLGQVNEFWEAIQSLESGGELEHIGIQDLRLDPGSKRWWQVAASKMMQFSSSPGISAATDPDPKVCRSAIRDQFDASLGAKFSKEPLLVVC